MSLNGERISGEMTEEEAATELEELYQDIKEEDISYREIPSGILPDLGRKIHDPEWSQETRMALELFRGLESSGERILENQEPGEIGQEVMIRLSTQYVEDYGIVPGAYAFEADIEGGYSLGVLKRGTKNALLAPLNSFVEGYFDGEFYGNK